jgi:hypothetical protein
MKRPPRRLTCRIFSIHDLDHLGDKIPLVFHRDKFTALAEIATHTGLSKRMRSLYYVGDPLKRQDWSEWLYKRSHRRYYRNGVMEFPTEIELRSRVSRLRPQHALGILELRATRTKAEIAASWRFNVLYNDQDRIFEERLHTSCLSTMFEGRPKLREVTLAFRSDDGGPKRRLKAARTAFAGAMTVAHGHAHNRFRTRLVDLVALAEGLKKSGRSLDSLTVVNVNYNALYGGVAMEDLDLAAGTIGDSFQLRALVRSLRRLQVFNHMTDRTDDKRYHPASPRTSVLTEAPELRVLETRLPDRVVDAQQPPSEKEAPFRVFDALRGGIILNYVFRTMSYPHLYELSLANCDVRANTLVDFILRHRQTLRRFYSIICCWAPEPGQTSRWERKGEAYAAPGTPDDGRALVDPARDYQEDEFDVWVLVILPPDC